MTASLTVITGPDSGRCCQLAPGAVLVVGRGQQCGLRLSDPGVSRIHCRIIAADGEGGGVRLEDADSRFGTIVNCRTVFTQSLLPGDLIEIGDTKLRFNESSSTVETVLPMRLAAQTVEAIAESMTFESVDPPPAARDATDLVGQTFLRFQIESLIARGSSGVVYRALDLPHGRPVALKVFWPSLFAGDQEMSRFLRAIRATIPLEHEHLIRLYSAGRSSSLCFTASEFVVGESVAQMVRRIGIAGMLDWRTTWRIAVSLTEALMYLHERQILHRSLRPDNILIREVDQCVKLGDSLLAKSLDQLGQPAITARGDIVGHIEYLAPEQLLADAAVDHRADLYSLGATIFALLTGHPPFSGPPAEIIRDIQTKQPESPRKLHLAVPASMEGIVLRLLSKRPDDRYSGAQVLLTELHRIGRYEGLMG